MADAAISGDGVFSHVCIGVSDLAEAERFYSAALAPLGITKLGAKGDRVLLYGKTSPALLVLIPANGGPPSSNGQTIGFAASSPAEVDAFHAAGIAAGGTSEGTPGPRNTMPGAYAAYLRDPAGNKICAYAFGPAG